MRYHKRFLILMAGMLIWFMSLMLDADICFEE